MITLNTDSSGQLNLIPEDVAGTHNVTIPSAGVGKLLQEVIVENSTYTTSANTIPSDNTKPQITEGTEILTSTFTPKSSNSTIVIQILCNVGNSGNVNQVVALFNGSADAIATSANILDAGYTNAICLAKSIASVSLTPITFSVRTGAEAGTTYINGKVTASYDGTLTSSIIIREIGA